MRNIFRSLFFVSFGAALLVTAGCSLGSVSTTLTNTTKTNNNKNSALTNIVLNANGNSNASNSNSDNADDNTNASPDTNSNVNAGVGETNVNADPGEDTTNDVVPSTDPAAKERDKVRKADVEKLQGALKKYFDAKKNYPDTLEGLVPTYISEIPKNPTPGGSDYTYTPIGSLPASFYDLTYTLEAGVDDVEAGLHSATPKGVAQP